MHSALIKTLAVPALVLSVWSTSGVAQADTVSGTNGEATVLTAGCPSDGWYGGVNSRCTSLSSGALFHQKWHPTSGTGEIKTWYVKSSGSAISMKLGYVQGGTTHYGSTVSQVSGTTKTKTWSTSYDNVCSATTGVMSVSGQGLFQTPSAHC
ncbi:hypothetical protein AB0I75_32230 [Streptomyces sp. NPDC050273]|uniref:hypothetical protein n=1 Tax=Streptomyces sp. NPDC050273 TaxID=3154933 RepID=UPI002F907C67